MGSLVVRALVPVGFFFHFFLFLSLCLSVSLCGRD